MLEDLRPKREEILGCRVLQRVAEHPDTTDEDIQLARQYLDDPKWGNYALQNALRSRGINVHKDSIVRHREKRCPCWKA